MHIFQKLHVGYLLTFTEKLFVLVTELVSSVELWTSYDSFHVVIVNIITEDCLLYL